MSGVVALDPLALLAELDELGRDPVRGGWSRHLFTPADLELRAWFLATARSIGLETEVDCNANLWAHWHEGDKPAVATGSHLDSVPGGGRLDGPLGVVAALTAVSRLRAEGHRPSAPIHVVVFAEEEGARFGAACVGSQLATGSTDRERLLGARDSEGVRLDELFAANGVDPVLAGPDPERIGGLAAFIELHVEQGRQLAPLGAPLGLGSSILAHGRWRLTVEGRGDHAGATEMTSRHDPVLVAAAVVAAARTRALAAPAAQRARATVGRLAIIPNGSNAIASRAELWLDARAVDDSAVRELVAGIVADANAAASAEGCRIEVGEESFSTRVDFDAPLTDLIDAVLGGVPRIPTGAGHDAGVLAAVLPTAMLFVRNPDGISHAPGESASDEDVLAGAAALTEVLRTMTRSAPS